MTLWMEVLISFETSEHTHPQNCRNIQRHCPKNLPDGGADVLRFVLFQLLFGVGTVQQRQRPYLSVPVCRYSTAESATISQCAGVSVQYSGDSDHISVCRCSLRKYRHPRQLSAFLWCYTTSRFFFVFLFDS
jgi:hypothetical protein